MGNNAGTSAGLLLAAGAGRRYGMPKALAKYNGQLLIELALGTLREAGCSPLVVVLGASAQDVVSQADLGDASVIVNSGWPTGMGSSLRAGLRALESTSAQSVVVLLVDMPGVTAAAVQRLLPHAGPDALAAAGYHGRQGHPVLLGRNHWDGITTAAVGDVGARPYLAAHAAQLAVVPCEDVADGTDLDVPPSPSAAAA